MEQNKVYIKHIKYQIKIIKMLNYRKKDLEKLVVIVIEIYWILYIFVFVQIYVLLFIYNYIELWIRLYNKLK